MVVLKLSLDTHCFAALISPQEISLNIFSIEQGIFSMLFMLAAK